MKLSNKLVEAIRSDADPGAIMDFLGATTIKVYGEIYKSGNNVIWYEAQAGGETIVEYWEPGWIVKVLTEPKNPENSSVPSQRQHEYIFLKEEIANQWLIETEEEANIRQSKYMEQW